EHAINLGPQCSGAPSLDPTHFSIEVALERISDRQKYGEMGPAQLSQQCCDNPDVGELPRELHHPAQVLFSKPATEFRLQLSPQRGNNLRAILGPLFLEDVLPHAAAYMPVQGGEPRVYGPRDPFAGLQD